MSELRLTNRGFAIVEFKDANGNECSLQESSAVRFEDDDGSVSDGKIWFGMDKDNNGEPVGKTVDGHKLGARMHLTQSQVRALLPLLQYFAEHGELALTPDTE